MNAQGKHSSAVRGASRLRSSSLQQAFAGALTAMLVVASAEAASKPVAQPAPTVAKSGYREVAQPFIEQHCAGCHGEKKAKAGFRIDLLGADFAAAKVADQWKEVVDRINAGEMPP